MKFVSKLANPELYRKLRLMRNLKAAWERRLQEKESLGDYVQNFLKETTRAPEVLTEVKASDYTCRPVRPPKDEAEFSIFIHLQLRMANLGEESSELILARFKARGFKGLHEPHVYLNEGGAFTYMKANDYRTPCTPGTDQVIPLNFILTASKELKKPLSASLLLEFANCGKRRIKLKIQHRRD